MHSHSHRATHLQTLVAAVGYRESNYICLVHLWICHRKCQQSSSPYFQHGFYVFPYKSTISRNNSELWVISGHNTEVRLLHFVTVFWLALPMHETLLWHSPQYLQIHSEVERHRPNFTGKGHPMFLWRCLRGRGCPLAGDLLGVESFQVYSCRFFCPLLEEEWPLTSSNWSVAFVTIRSRSLMKKAVC